MTVLVSGDALRYAGNDTADTFAYQGVIFAASDLEVHLEDAYGNAVTQVLNTDYTVTGVGLLSGGSVVFTTPPASGETVSIRVSVPTTQPQSIRNQGSFLPEIHETAFDRLTRQVQKLERQLEFAMRLPDYGPEVDMTVPSLQNRKGKYWARFNETTGAPELFESIGATALSQSIVGQHLWPQTAAETSAGVTPTYYYYPPGDVRRYGANTTPGTTDMTTAVAAAFSVSATHPALIPQETHLITSALTVPDYGVVRGEGRNSLLKKGFNGDLITLNKHSQLSSFRIDGVRATYTGRGVVISSGGGGATTADQGQQLLFNMIIDECAGYPVEYTGATYGWQSVLLRCQFSNYNSDAAVKWPDEAGTGENRKLIGCYASDALINVGGADNGMIKACVSGIAAGANGGMIWPAGTTNRAKKLIVVGNRFAIGGGTMTIRGIDSVFSNNVVAGSITLASNAAADGCATLTYANNLITGTFTDSSGTTNYVYLDVPISFTPTWTSTGTAPALGNADVRCEYTRRGMHIRAKYFIKFGSTSTYGTGTYKFSIPVNRYTSTTTMFVGVALLKDRAGVVQTLFQSSDDSVRPFDGSGNAMTPTAPVTWASGDVLCMDIEYRIG